ncbi:MAG: efflux RND transporter periplasmic adaptor subunit [Maricaulaceae bacterium]
MPTPYGKDATDIIPMSSTDRVRLWFARGLVFVLPVLVILAAVIGTVAMGSLKPKTEEKAEEIKAIPVITVAAVQRSVTLKVRSQGNVQPRTEIGVTAQVGGLITQMSPKFIEGGQFKKGDLLAQIDPREYELRVTQARAEVAQAQTVISREQTESSIAQKDWDDLGRAGEPTALTLRKPQLAEAQANLAAAEARLGEAELQLSRSFIYAPFNGRVTEQTIDRGEFVTAGTRLGEIYGDEIMDIRLPLTQAELQRLGMTLGYKAPKSGGVPVTLSTQVAGQTAEWPAHIVRTDSRFDNESRVLFVYAEARDPFGQEAPLAPGLFVDAQIKGQTLEDMIVVPRAALRGADKVYVATPENSLTIKTVDIASSNRDEAIISAGLSAGEAVITSPIRGVAEGMKIDVVDSTAVSTGGDAR